MKKIVLTVAALAAVFMLGGCAEAQNIIDKGVSTDLGYDYRVMDAVEIQTYAPNGAPSSPRVTVVDKTTIDLVLGGSSSCPPTIDNIDDAADGSVRVTLKTSTGPCTADFGPYGFQITGVKTNFDFATTPVYVCSGSTCTKTLVN
jgi:hypothetical protein